MRAHEIPTMSVWRPAEMDGSEIAKIRLAVPVMNVTSRAVPSRSDVLRTVIWNEE